MLQATIVELVDVSDKPRVKLDLPSPFRIGDTLTLLFRLRRQKNGRTEALDVSGKFRVTSVGMDASSGAGRQHLGVEALGASPNWKAIKKSALIERQLPPSKFPRTIVV